MIKVLASIRFKDGVMLDSGNPSRDMRQAYIDRAILTLTEKIIIVSSENKVTKTDVYVPWTNVVSMKIYQTIEGDLAKFLDNKL